MADFPCYGAYLWGSGREIAMPARKTQMTEAERSRRFVATAKEIGGEESTEAFDRVFEKILPAKRAPAKPLKSTPKDGSRYGS